MNQKSLLLVSMLVIIGLLFGINTFFIQMIQPAQASIQNFDTTSMIGWHQGNTDGF
jgi:hypothetical protein